MPTHPPSRTRSLLASLRIANALSVISNVWLGYMLGRFYWGSATPPWLTLVLLTHAGLSLYFAGNLANDWFDRAWDKTHRPERALPSGHYRPASYLVAALLLALSGCWAAALVAPLCLFAALGIALLITIYTYLHKKSRWAVIPMGLCRAGLYALGFLASWPWNIEPSLANDYISYAGHSGYDLLTAEFIHSFLFISCHALGLLIYIAGLSLAARYESVEAPPHGMVFLSRAMLFLPIAAMSAWWMRYYPIPTLVALLPFSLWLTLTLTRFRRPIPVLVSALLAGIPLIDFIAALPLASSMYIPDFNIAEQPLLLATVIVPLTAFALGRILQKVSPAT